jgi:transcriptional regulator with XRE-family HTH domain
MEFWQRIKALCALKSISFHKLAEEIDTPYNTIRTWINRRFIPSVEVVKKISTLLDTTIEYLTDGRNIPGMMKGSASITRKPELDIVYGLGGQKPLFLSEPEPTPYGNSDQKTRREFILNRLCKKLASMSLEVLIDAEIAVDSIIDRSSPLS